MTMLSLSLSQTNHLNDWSNFLLHWRYQIRVLTDDIMACFFRIQVSKISLFLIESTIKVPRWNLISSKLTLLSSTMETTGIVFYDGNSIIRGNYRAASYDTGSYPTSEFKFQVCNRIVQLVCNLFKFLWLF